MTQPIKPTPPHVFAASTLNQLLKSLARSVPCEMCRKNSRECKHTDSITDPDLLERLTWAVDKAIAK